MQISSIPDGQQNLCYSYRLYSLIQRSGTNCLNLNCPFSLTKPAKAPAMEFGLDFAETFKTLMVFLPLFLHTKTTTKDKLTLTKYIQAYINLILHKIRNSSFLVNI